MEREADLNKSCINFTMSLIDSYKLFVFVEKEFVFSKRLLESGMQVCSLYFNNDVYGAWVKAVETKFWLGLICLICKSSDITEIQIKSDLYEHINKLSEELLNQFKL